MFTTYSVIYGCGYLQNQRDFFEIDLAIEFAIEMSKKYWIADIFGGSTHIATYMAGQDKTT